MRTNSDTARTLYESFGRGDLVAFKSTLNDQIQWVYSDGHPYDTQTGPQAVLENVLAPVAHDFASFTATVNEFIEAGDVVCALGRYGGTANDTGTALRVDFVHVLRFGPDGKIVHFQEFADTHTIRQVLGR